VLNRQKIILEILKVAEAPVSKLELMKWAFVLARESPNGGGEAFYEFLPYHYGPYSFSLQRDMDQLVQAGQATATEKSWHTNAHQQQPIVLQKSLLRDIRATVERFRSWPVNELIDYVYQNYPKYTVNSKRERLAVRPSARLAVYTSGYEGLQIDGFLDRLVQSGIRRLIDVRNNPVARRYGFHKSTLQRLCGYLEIDYTHCPELGVLSADRQKLDSPDDYSSLFYRYEKVTLKTQSESVDNISKLMQDAPSVLVCMEAEACRCHRSRLATEVAGRTGMDVVHLGEMP